MQDIKGFRRYYNDHLHGELVAFERKRRWVAFLVVLVVGSLVITTITTLAVGIMALTFFLVVPWWVGLQFLRGRIKHFKSLYKPLVVRSILRFIDPRMKYYHDAYIPQDTFDRSNIFRFETQIYTGEDYIMGKIGEVFFEMSELEVHGWVGAQAKMKLLFEGIFFHANFNTPFKGRIVIVPRPEWQLFIKVIKDFAKYGGGELKGIGDESFQKEFMVYIDQGVQYKEVLTPTLLQTINNYHLQSGKKVYASIIDSHFFIAIHEPHELLEAHVLTSNINFELFHAFYEELYLFTRLVEDFDIGH